MDTTSASPRPLGLRFATDFANTDWARTGGETEPHGAPAAWRELCAAHGDPELGEREAEAGALAAVAAELLAVFAESDPQLAATRVNAALRAHPGPSELAQLPDGRWVTRPALPRDASAAVAARVLISSALAQWFAERGRCAWGRCAAADCGRAFIDEGRRTPQRFCSQSCATRTRVAAHRAAQRGAGSGSGRPAS